VTGLAPLFDRLSLTPGITLNERRNRQPIKLLNFCFLLKAKPFFFDAESLGEGKPIELYSETHSKGELPISNREATRYAGNER
jgi:hypothetical protein